MKQKGGIIELSVGRAVAPEVSINSEGHTVPVLQATYNYWPEESREMRSWLGSQKKKMVITMKKLAILLTLLLVLSLIFGAVG